METMAKVSVLSSICIMLLLGCADLIDHEDPCCKPKPCPRIASVEFNRQFCDYHFSSRDHGYVYRR